MGNAGLAATLNIQAQPASNCCCQISDRGTKAARHLHQGTRTGRTRHNTKVASGLWSGRWLSVIALDQNEMGCRGQGWQGCPVDKHLVWERGGLVDGNKPRAQDPVKGPCHTTFSGVLDRSLKNKRSTQGEENSTTGWMWLCRSPLS